MDPRDAVTLVLLFAIPVAAALLVMRPLPQRAAVMPRRDGPLAAVVGGLALAGWVTYVGPLGTEPFLVVGLAIAGVGLVWHLARTVRRLNAAQA